MWSEREKRRRMRNEELSELQLHHPWETWVVTNDRMMDHRWSVISNFDFKAWRDSRTIAFDIGAQGSEPVGLHTPEQPRLRAPDGGYLLALLPPPPLLPRAQRISGTSTRAYGFPRFGNAYEDVRSTFYKAEHSSLTYMPVEASAFARYFEPHSSEPSSPWAHPVPPVATFVAAYSPQPWLLAWEDQAWRPAHLDRLQRLKPSSVFAAPF
jgi:hypothetical protein